MADPSHVKMQIREKNVVSRVTHPTSTPIPPAYPRFPNSAIMKFQRKKREKSFVINPKLKVSKWQRTETSPMTNGVQMSMKTSGAKENSCCLQEARFTSSRKWEGMLMLALVAGRRKHHRDIVKMPERNPNHRVVTARKAVELSCCMMMRKGGGGENKGGGQEQGRGG